MKKTSCNAVHLNKLKGQLTNKNITSLLILVAIIVVLFAAPTAVFASGNRRDDRGPVATANVRRTPPHGPSQPTPEPWISIHMLDKTHGWALTQSLVLKTADGGLHWQKVIPIHSLSNHTTPQGFFLNAQDAWIVLPQEQQKTISVLRTTDGGKSWQNSTIQTPAESRSVPPYFLSPSDGWLQTFGQSGDRVSAIFHTTDGGLHWNEPGKLNAKDIPDPSGSSFIDNQNGWETGGNPAAAGPSNPQPLLEVTHDGGKTWQSQSLPSLPGAGKSDMLSTSPPVFFGNDGLLPVEDQIGFPRVGFNLYVTHNGGQTWTPTKLVVGTTTRGIFTVDVVDMQHAWVTLGTDLYVTSDGGQNWTKLPPAPQPIEKLSFVDTNNGWGTTPTNLLHTTDGGRTWQPINYSIAGQPITTSTTRRAPTSTPPVGRLSKTPQSRSSGT